MKSLTILRAFFAIAFLALTTNAIVAAATNDTKTVIESVSQASLIGLATPMLNKTNFAKRKTFRAVAAGGVTVIRNGSGGGRTVGEQDLMKNNPEYAGSRGGQANTLQSNMPTPYNMVMPEGTMAGLLTFKLTADGTHTRTNAVPFLPSSSTDTLPTGVTFSNSNFATFAAFAAFYYSTNAILSDVQVTTDVVANFANAITCTTLGANGAPQSSQLSWNSISKNPMNYDQNTRVVYQTGWVIGKPKVKYTLLMEVSSYLDFACTIAQIADVNAFRPYNG